MFRRNRVACSFLDIVRPILRATWARSLELAKCACAFVDANGAGVTGDVRVAMTTLNPTRRSIPGDYRAVTRGGQQAEMLSFGALYVDITDPQDGRFRLKQGVAADLWPGSISKSHCQKHSVANRASRACSPRPQHWLLPTFTCPLSRRCPSQSSSSLQSSSSQKSGGQHLQQAQPWPFPLRPSLHSSQHSQIV